MKYESIEKWSRNLGSKANTKQGQIKAIHKYIKELKPIFFRQKNYYCQTFGHTMEYKACKRAEILGYPPENPEYDLYSEAYQINDRVNAYSKRSIESLETALNKKYNASWDEKWTYINLGHDIIAIVAWNEHADWNYYAKSYGRPKNTYSNRRVEIHNKFEGEKLCIMVDSFQGEFLRKALIEAGQKLHLPWLIESIRIIPTKKQQQIIELATPKTCYKRVAINNQGKFVSIFDGMTEYTLGEVVHNTPKKCPDYDDICEYGGIFVHRTIEKANTQKYPTNSQAIEYPRVTLKGEYWGKVNENGKIATEYFRPMEVIKTI